MPFVFRQDINMKITRSNLIFISTITSLFFNINLSIAKDIWQEDKNTYIKISPSQDVNNSHPFSLSNESVSKILTSIHVKKSSKSTEPLFSEEQITLLSNYLPIALSKAASNEDVIFALSQKKSSLGGLKTSTYYVSGSAFVSEGKLNILIGEHNKVANRAYEMAYDPTNQGIVEYDFNFGNRIKPKFGFDTPVSFTANGLALANSNRNDWIVSELDVQPMQSVAKNTMMVSTNVQPTVIKASMQENEKSDDLVARFKQLEALKNANLITEEEYKMKRKQLLDEL